MTDIENQVFTKVKTALKAVYPKVFVSGDYVDAPAEFPCVFLMEMSNVPLTSTRTSSSNDVHDILMYQLDVYSAKSNGRKSEAKKIAATADTAMQSLGFTRIMLEPVLNSADTSVYRITGRYTCVVDTNEVIFRR